MLSKILSISTIFFLSLSFLIFTNSLSSQVWAQTPEMDQMKEEFDRMAEETSDIYEQKEAIEQEAEEIKQENEELKDMALENFNNNIEVMNKSTGLISSIFNFFTLGSSALLVIILFLSLISILGVIFNLLMFIDCNRREFKDKTLWTVLLLVGLFSGFGIIISAIYYFTVKKELDAQNNQESVSN